MSTSVRAASHLHETALGLMYRSTPEARSLHALKRSAAISMMCNPSLNEVDSLIVSPQVYYHKQQSAGLDITARPSRLPGLTAACHSILTDDYREVG